MSMLSMSDAPAAPPLVSTHRGLRLCGTLLVVVALLSGLPGLVWGVGSYYVAGKMAQAAQPTAGAQPADGDALAESFGASMAGFFGVMGLVACAASFAWIVMGSAAGLALRALADIANEVRWARVAIAGPLTDDSTVASRLAKMIDAYLADDPG